MSDALILVLFGMLPGAAIGATAALAIAHWRGMFNPVIKVGVTLRTGPETREVSVAQDGDYTVVVRPSVFADWQLIYDAARGAGYAIVPKEFAPPQH